MKKKDYRSCKGIARALGFAALAVAVLSAWGQRSLFKDTSRGLSDLNINTLTQDRAGFLWVGTENGLFRYDGFRFQRFGVEQGVGSRNIQNLFAAPDGTLWAGTASGIYFLRQDGSFAEVHPPPSLSQFSPRIGTVFAADAQNRVVVADRSGAYLLHKASPEQWIAEAMPLPAQEIWSLHFDARGALWYGCDSDLCTTDHGATQRMAAAAKLPAEHWQCIVEDGDGHLWLRGQQHLAEFFPREKRAELHDLPVPSKEHFSLTLSRNGKGQMVAAQGSALGIWENGHWRMVTERNGLEPNDISALFVDRQGLLWIGQVGHGLKRWVGEGQWSAYTVADGLSNNSVWSTLRDRAGRLWIGTESGLDWIPAGQSTPRAWQLKGISTAQAMALAQSGDGASWVGSRAGGVVRIEANGLRATAWKTPRVYRILADSQQRLWFATAGGLYMADTAHTRAAPRPVKDAAFSNPRQRITDLSLGAQLWAAAESGLYRLEGKQWRHIDTGLSGVIPMRIAADRQGNLWSAGNFPGLMRLRVVGGRVQEAEHIAHPPLLSDAINSLVVDHRGWLWMGQDAGLTLFDGKNWHSFSQNDGLLWNDCNASALSEDQDGSLWIGTSGGLAHLIDPVAVAPAPALLLSLSHATVGAVPLSNGAEILWRDNPLDLSFAALDFAHPQPSGIRYRLLGLENEWEQSANGTVRYPRLSPGNYRFQAVAEDAAGSIASPPLEIPFRILPRWWQSTWLRAILAGLALLAVVLSWRRWIHQRAIKMKQIEAALRRRMEGLEQERAGVRQARERMRHFAEYDDLTGLWNRRVILDRLRGEVDRARRHKEPLSLILVDLDRFREINEDFGHQTGDRILQEVSRILLRAVRSYDWVGRYGGSEFLVILPDSDSAAAMVRAEQLRIAIESAYTGNGERDLNITASFGVASGAQAGFTRLVEAASRALSQAKEGGGGCVRYWEIDAVEAPIMTPR